MLKCEQRGELTRSTNIHRKLKNVKELHGTEDEYQNICPKVSDSDGGNHRDLDSWALGVEFHLTYGSVPGVWAHNLSRHIEYHGVAEVQRYWDARIRRKLRKRSYICGKVKIISGIIKELSVVNFCFCLSVGLSVVCLWLVETVTRTRYLNTLGVVTLALSRLPTADGASKSDEFGVSERFRESVGFLIF